MRTSIVASSVVILALAGCGSNSPTRYQLVMATGSPLAAHAGDALHITVMEMLPNGETASLPDGAQVDWTMPATITALPRGSMPASSQLPACGPAPTSFWIRSPEHFQSAELAGVLWVLDAGTGARPTIAVQAMVSGAAPAGMVTAAIAVGAMPAGDVSRGTALYGANCAECHGATGHGTPAFPGLNNEPGNVAGDPAWSPALLAMTARSDMDNQGVSLAPSMPKWLTRIAANGKLLSGQDFADIYSFLKTQDH